MRGCNGCSPRLTAGMNISSYLSPPLPKQHQNPNQLRVATYLKGQASRINSRVLSALAMRVEADPFGKVKKMIKDQ